jgi:hypothetical protein
VIGGHHLLGLIRQYVVGGDCYTKHFSSRVWDTPLDFLRGIVDGWLAADAYIPKKYLVGKQEYTRKPHPPEEVWKFGITTNWALVHDLEVLCGLVGYRFRYKRCWVNSNFGQYKAIIGTVRKHRTEYQSAKSNWEVMTVEPIDKFTPVAVEVDGDNLFLLPDGTVSHNSCIKAVESAFCSIPCLMSWQRPYEEFVSHDKELQWLLCAGKSSWEKKLRVLINEPALRNDLGRRMNQVMHAHYSWDRPHEGWQKVIEAARSC